MKHWRADRKKADDDAYFLMRLMRRRGMGVGGLPDTTAPTITSANTANNAENAVLAHALTASETVTWSIPGGISADDALFEISGSTLRWLANTTRNFEAPADANTDNAYVVTVRATDIASNTTDQIITVTVTDVVATVTFRASAVDATAGSTTSTFLAQSISTASVNRTVLVVVMFRAAAITISSMTIQGITASIVGTGVTNGSNRTEMWGVAVPTGTTADIVITFSTTATAVGIAVYTANELNSLTPTMLANDTAAAGDPGVMSSVIDAPAGGFVIGSALNTGAATWVWSNLTERSDALATTSIRVTTASDNFAAADAGRTITTTLSSTAGSSPVQRLWAMR